MPSKVVFSLSRIRKVVNGRTILSGIDWEIRRGEHWALLGANGSGKTTLLRIVAGYDWPTEGEVRVLGRRFGEVDLRELRKAIGWATSSLLERFNGEEPAEAVVLSGLEASIGLWRSFTKSERERAGRALAAIGGKGFLHQAYGTLSQGERQRALIARALVARPRLLVLDEPCAGLDPVARESFLADLARLASRPRAPTLVLVTHHVEEIPPFITHALILKDGRMLARGRIERALSAATLGRALGRHCSLDRRDGRFHLRVLDASRRGSRVPRSEENDEPPRHKEHKEDHEASKSIND